MPYIGQNDRAQFDAAIGELGTFVSDPGELNYVLTSVCLEYVYRKGERYATFNDIIGALEGAKLEFYRRAVAPYEDTKIESNGDLDGYAYANRDR